jgi:hypothetical protein
MARINLLIHAHLKQVTGFTEDLTGTMGIETKTFRAPGARSPTAQLAAMPSRLRQPSHGGTGAVRVHRRARTGPGKEHDPNAGPVELEGPRRAVQVPLPQAVAGHERQASICCAAPAPRVQGPAASAGDCQGRISATTSSGDTVTTASGDAVTVGHPQDPSWATASPGPASESPTARRLGAEATFKLKDSSGDGSRSAGGSDSGVCVEGALRVQRRSGGDKAGHSRAGVDSDEPTGVTTIASGRVNRLIPYLPFLPFPPARASNPPPPPRAIRARLPGPGFRARRAPPDPPAPQATQKGLVCSEGRSERRAAEPAPHARHGPRRPQAKVALVPVRLQIYIIKSCAGWAGPGRAGPGI